MYDKEKLEKISEIVDDMENALDHNSRHFYANIHRIKKILRTPT